MIWVTFNGEIYNYRELRALLKKRGHFLCEKGDTEVLVHLWEEFGQDMVEYLNGMFAFAIYDLRHDILFLARDRFGEKPVFYWDSPDQFAFASELHALTQLDAFPEEQLDVEAIGQFFRLGYIPHPRTVYEAAKVLSPGCALTRHGGITQVTIYWRPDVAGTVDTLEPEEFATRFDAAVTSRLVADVPVGCFLSGGLDSSLIAASMAAVGTPRTFTIATGDPNGDESAIAKRISAYLGAQHQEFRVEPDFITVSERLARHFGQPFADYSAVPTYYVSRETRREVKVALSGDGGDELFAGYDRYANVIVAAWQGMLPFRLRQLAAKCLVGHGDFYSHMADFLLSAGSACRKIDAPSSLFHRHWRERVFEPAFLRTTASVAGPQGNRYAQARGDSLSRQLETDQALYLPADILTKVDIAAMSVSLETRAPFLDHHFVEYVNGLAVFLKRRGRRGKLPLRALAAKRLPPDVAGLPKQGFTLPLARWMRHEIRDWCHATLFDAPDVWATWLRPEAVAGLWREHQEGRRDHSMRLWTIIAMGLWRRGLRRGNAV